MGPEDPKDTGTGPCEWVVPITADARGVRVGRRYVESVLRREGRADAAADGGLVAAELLANAVQHGAPPVTVRVLIRAEIRIEVDDAGPWGPVPTPGESTSMTGRGMRIVEGLCRSWGIYRYPYGKTIWAELGAAAEPAEGGPEQAPPLLASWLADEDEAAGALTTRYPVALPDVPTRLVAESKAQVDSMVRELALAAAGSGPHGLPAGLVEVFTRAVDGFTDALAAIKRQVAAAHQRGEPRMWLSLRLPLAAADAGLVYLAALDDVDRYARAARLLTLETPPELRLFRRWYVHAIADQLHAVAERRPAPPVPAFEDVLVDELRRLAPVHRIAEHASRLLQVSAALARTRTPEDVARTVLDTGVRTLGAAAGALLVADPGRSALRLLGSVGYTPDLRARLRDQPLDAPLPSAHAVRTGEPVWLESADERDRAYPDLARLETATQALCTIPLLYEGTPIGVLRFSFTTTRLFDHDERTFVTALADHTAHALARTLPDRPRR